MTNPPRWLLARVFAAVFIVQTVLGTPALAKAPQQEIYESNPPAVHAQRAQSAIELVATILERYSLDAGLGVADEPGKSGATGARGRTSHYRIESASNAGTQLTAGNNIALNAVKAITATGSAVNATGSISISAASVTLQAARDSLAIDQQGVSRRGYERVAKSDEMLSGGTVSAGGDLSVIARDNIAVQGAQLVAGQGQVSLIAGGDVNVDALTAQHSTFGESWSQRNGTFSSSMSQRDSASQASVAHGSLVSGSSIAMQAGQPGMGNITVTGSNLVADNDISLRAGNNVTIQAATNTESSRLAQLHKETGFGAVGDLSYGSSSESFKGNGASTTALASTVGSLGGNVSITAGNAYRQTGSDVLASRAISPSRARQSRSPKRAKPAPAPARRNSSKPVSPLTSAIRSSMPHAASARWPVPPARPMTRA